MKTIKKYMRKYTNRLLLTILSLCGLLLAGTAHAQNNFVGDGFGGRSWYKPTGWEGSPYVFSLNHNGQIWMWGNNVNIPSLPVPMALPFTSMNDQGDAVIGSPNFVDERYAHPQAISSLNNVKLISLASTGAAIKTDGSGWVWGGVYFTAPPNSQSAPMFPSQPTMVIPSGCKHLATGAKHMAFVKDDGTVWSVGLNYSGQFGTGTANTTTVVTTPVQMPGITNAVRVSVGGSGYGGTLVLKSDHTVWVSGGGGYLLGQAIAGNPSTMNIFSATQVQGLPNNIVDVQGGLNVAVALTATGEVWRWGVNVEGGGGAMVPAKVVFPAVAKPFVAIRSEPTDASAWWAIDEAGNLYCADFNNGDGLNGGGSPYHRTPHIAAHHVIDVIPSAGYIGSNWGTIGQACYIVRDNQYPPEERLWVRSADGVLKLSDEALSLTQGNKANNLTDPEYTNTNIGASWSYVGDWVWMPARPSDVGLPCDGCTPIVVVTGAGTIDCSKTQLYPAPKAGTASQLSLIVTVNVTTAGCFTPITVSGSGFSINSDFTQQCVTGTGIQQLHIPVNYDGSTLGTLNFSVGQAGSCAADLTKAPKKKEVDIWTLDNCTPINAGPVLK